MTQVNTNPYKNSDSNKRYYTYNYYLKQRFGKKCAKITLDLGFSCPNIDGTRGYGGCIYCSGGSSSVNCRSVKDIKEQFEKGTELVQKKWKGCGFIAYMQAYTNTHTTPQGLKEAIEKVLALPDIVMLDIATRADCLENEKLEIINEASKRIPITLELGLQSSNDETAKRINRCHDFSEFCDAIERIRKYAKNVKIGVHIINGLPGENYDDMIKTVQDVSVLRPDLIKIHLLHVIQDTKLAKMYELGEYEPISRDEYIKVVCDQIELLPPDTVIERLTGDGIGSDLLAPEWSRKKVTVINDIDKELFSRGSYQGIKFNA